MVIPVDPDYVNEERDICQDFYNEIMKHADIRIYYHKEHGAFYAVHNNLDIMTQGDSFTHACEMIKECTMLYVEGAISDGLTLEEFKEEYLKV